MQKIMFNDHYGLTDAVIQGRKMMTRRFCKDKDTNEPIFADDVLEPFIYYDGHGNIEVRPTKYESEPYEIICWQRNAQYYEKDQYELVPGSTTSYRRKDGTGHCTWDVSCFQKPETCYVLAIVLDRKDEEPDIRSVGNRPWDLSEADRADFDEIVNAVFKDYYASYGNEME